jgi:hypothetical protein
MKALLDKWIKKTQYIAKSVENMGKQDPDSSLLWQVDGFQFSIKNAQGTPVQLERMTIVRLLAFIANPINENWKALNADLHEGVTKPFCHNCNNGMGSQLGGGGRRPVDCQNGIQHGSFRSAQMNQNQRDCRTEKRETCPGARTYFDHR